ncbi:carbohydrate ABC transporter permease [Caldilinea sp.]|jgi:inositol-phosphate transport system permease protein|uniref:carbohydrate ABC transporter permease n=1 Tax=Caldilinea sp. TaxID=2293560 RepID=UPI0021DE4C81|nr:carbohydrate ABC transporter permease [Caldilinea sp.]GIV67728.1 MAG: sugar ABC transporter permease [Caldilinea sp.]
MEDRLGMGGRWRVAILLLILTILTVPILIGYVWILISTFSQRTYGLIPVDASGQVGGLTLRNWSFLWEDPNIWKVTLNSLILAIGLTIGVVLVSSMAGYVLSRISFPGRRVFLGTTLVLHAFPSVTLLIAIFFVLRWISRIPILGRDLPIIGGFGYNTLGGVILVMLALQLPLGVWLMKGFFDHVSWDMERAALIDGCSRWRTWWQILLPQIRPGIAALAIFSFISGWNEFLIPYTYITDQQQSTIAAYLNKLLSDTAPVNYSQVAAVGLFQLIPVMLFFLFTQEYLLSIFAGGAKGGS